MNIVYENLKKVNQSFFNQLHLASQSVIENGWYILGKEVEKFECQFASYHSMKYCIGVASGLDALKLSLKSLSLPKNSEVILSANSYIATILAVTQAELKPVLVEPDLATGNIDVSQIKKAISRNTRVILPVHCYGQPCAMNELIDIANQYQLIIIEDCAQAHGATYFDQKVGTFGTLSAFSFYPTKNLGALGDGGAILTNDETLNEKIKSLRNYGEAKKYVNQYKGINSRLDEIQAAFLNVKLPYLDEINNHKIKLAQHYYKKLSDKIDLPPIIENTQSVFHIFNIRHNQRDALKAYLAQQGIGTAIHYPTPPYKQQAYLNEWQTAHYPISDKWHDTTLSLPISFGHTLDEIDYVAQQVAYFIKENSTEAIF